MKIKIVKSTFGGVKYVAVPKVLRPGGVGSWGDLVLEFELPEGWDKYAVTLHTQQEGASDAGVPILLEDGKATVDSRITAARRGLWMLMATDGETVTAMTEPGSWECYDTVDLDGTTEALDKTVYEQFVAKVMAIADNAQDAADSAKWSETIAVNFASEAESWAVGGTGRRTGEDTDNAKYYAEQAEATLELITDASAYAVEAKEAAAQAKTYATDAKTSEANAKGSETAAGSSAAAAAKSATAAEASNQAAQDAAENASTSETNAKASQTAAASSASTASSKASAASTSATKAANSATAAATSATNAADSATAAAASAKEAAAYTIDFTGASSSTAGVHGLVPAPEAGAQESYLRGDGTWAVPTDTTYTDATISKAGLMSASDKAKLDGIEAGATAVNSIAPLKVDTAPTATAEYTLAIGDSASATQDTATAVGQKAQATNYGATAVGRAAKATGQDGIAIGCGATAEGRESISIGFMANALGEDSVALGAGSNAGEDESSVVSIGWNSITSDGTKTEITRRITHVTDPVNDSDAATKAYVDSVGVVASWSNGKTNGQLEGYVRFGDGTQICYKDTGENTSSSYVWTYPINFMNQPTIQITIYSSGSTVGHSAVIKLLTSVSVTVSKATSDYAIHILAIGRWK